MLEFVGGSFSPLKIYTEYEGAVHGGSLKKPTAEKRLTSNCISGAVILFSLMLLLWWKMPFKTVLTPRVIINIERRVQPVEMDVFIHVRGETWCSVSDCHRYKDLFSKFGMVHGISSRSSNHVQVCLEDNHKVETMPNPNRSSRESSIDQFECH